MRLRRQHDGEVVHRGPSLAKGPALIIGTTLLAYGLLGMLVNADFPQGTTFPDGTAQGESWLGPEVNGWTNFICVAAGGLLLFGAAQHLLAKTMSLLVGLALAACAVIALVDGQDVFGLAAANDWTKLGWAIAGSLLLLNALMPRVEKRETVDRHDVAGEPDRVDVGRDHDHVDRDRDYVDRDPDHDYAPPAAEPNVTAPAATATPGTAGPVDGDRTATPGTAGAVDGDRTTRFEREPEPEHATTPAGTGTGHLSDDLEHSRRPGPRRSGGLVDRLRGRRANDL